MQTDGYEIVRYRPEFRAGLLTLHPMVWSPDPAVNSACLDWKHFRNPYLTEPRIYLALHEGKVVGTRAVVGAKWEAGQSSETFLVPCTCDLIVAPEHRDRGLVTKLAAAIFRDLARDGFEYVVNLSAGPTTQMAALAAGWRIVRGFGPLRRPCVRTVKRGRLRSFARRIPFLPPIYRGLKSLARQAPAPESTGPRNHFAWLDASVARSQGRLDGHVSVESSPRHEEMAGLIQRIGHDGRIRHVRDATYLKWRYQNPLYQYRFLYWENNRLEGYLVLQAVIRSTETAIEIADWEASEPRVRADLLNAVVERSNFDGEITAWSASVPSGEKSNLLTAGFVDADKAGSVKDHTPRLMVRAIRNEMVGSEWRLAQTPLLDMANWDIRMIYRD